MIIINKTHALIIPKDINPEFAQLLLQKFTTFCLYRACFEKRDEADFYFKQIELAWVLKCKYRRMLFKEKDILNQKNLDLWKEKMKEATEAINDQQYVDDCKKFFKSLNTGNQKQTFELSLDSSENYVEKNEIDNSHKIKLPNADIKKMIYDFEATYFKELKDKKKIPDNYDYKIFMNNILNIFSKKRNRSEEKIKEVDEKSKKLTVSLPLNNDIRLSLKAMEKYHYE